MESYEGSGGIIKLHLDGANTTLEKSLTAMIPNGLFGGALQAKINNTLVIAHGSVDEREAILQRGRNLQALANSFKSNSMLKGKADELEKLFDTHKSILEQAEKAFEEDRLKAEAEEKSRAQQKREEQLAELLRDEQQLKSLQLCNAEFGQQMALIPGTFPNVTGYLRDDLSPVIETCPKLLKTPETPADNYHLACDMTQKFTNLLYTIPHRAFPPTEFRNSVEASNEWYEGMSYMVKNRRAYLECIERGAPQLAERINEYGLHPKGTTEKHILKLLEPVYKPPPITPALLPPKRKSEALEEPTTTTGQLPEGLKKVKDEYPNTPPSLAIQCPPTGGTSTTTSQPVITNTTVTMSQFREMLVQAATEAERNINWQNRALIKGVKPQRDECTKKVTDPLAKHREIEQRVLWGRMKHAEARKLVETQMNGRSLVDEKGNPCEFEFEATYYEKAELKGPVEYLGQDRGRLNLNSLQPDVVVRPGGELTTINAIFDFKFSCPPGYNANWRTAEQREKNFGDRPIRYKGMSQDHIYMAVLNCQNASLISPRM